ncbi:MAG: hypothetical protein ACR2HE_00070 [Casimicrobiaceae bacterium]
MPLVEFRPTKARLVIEDSNDTILVMRVVLAEGETLELTHGGKLDALGGVLRVRRRTTNGERNGKSAIGSLVYVGESNGASEHTPAKFQINIAMAEEKFDALLRVAISGRLPTKFFVDAGERVSRTQTAGLVHDIRAGKRVKVWETRSHRTLPVMKFTMILPIEVPEQRPDAAAPTETTPEPSPVSDSQVAELVDELIVSQSETRHTMLALVSVVGVIALVALAIALVLIAR